MLITLLLGWSGAFTRLQLSSFDHRVKTFRLDKHIHDDVVVVLIDELSLQQMQSSFGRWPWPRSAYDDILQFFTQAKAQAVAFDILFSEQQNAGGLEANSADQVLIEATQQAGNVIHSMQLTHILDDTSGRPLSADFKQKHQINQIDYVGENYENYLIPFEGLYQVSEAVGNLEIEPDSDGSYRRIRLFNQYQDSVFPAISTAIVVPLVAGDNRIRYGLNKALLGGLEIPLDGEGKYLINPVGQINSVSIARIFFTMENIRAGKSDPANLNLVDFENKLILIGASAIGLLDVKATALSPTEPGVFLHAATVSNILEQDFLQKTSIEIQWLIVVLASAISIIPILLFSRIWLAILLPLFFSLAYFIVTYAAFSSNLILPLITVLFSVVCSLLLALYFRLSAEKKHKQKVRIMLSQYVSPNVLSSVIDHYEELEADIGKKENLSILFSDIRSFTNISEQFDAREIVDLLNIYFSAMTDIIFDENGTLNKFIGDAILAFWGAPIKTEYHADQALSAALLMREKLPQVNQLLLEKGYTSIDVGIGIHTGDVILGNIGSEKKLDYTIIGDAVNLASRVEGLTKLYGVSILLSEDTLNALSQPVVCIKVDKVTVKGKQQPILLYTPAQTFLSENNLDMPLEVLEKITNTAFDCYQQQDWLQAKQQLQPLSETKLYKMLIQRCEHYANRKPETNWSGVYEHTAK